MSGAGQRAPRSLGSRAYAAVWWTITSAALLALLSGAAMFGPLTRKNRFMQPELAEQVARDHVLDAWHFHRRLVAVPAVGDEHRGYTDNDAAEVVCTYVGVNGAPLSIPTGRSGSDTPGRDGLAASGR